MNSIKSTYLNSDYSEKGGIFYLYSALYVNFTDTESVFQCKIYPLISLENLALRGGIIYCYNCFSINLKQPSLSYNKALIAAALYLEYSESSCQSNNISLALNNLKIANL